MASGLSGIKQTDKKSVWPGAGKKKKAPAHPQATLPVMGGGQSGLVGLQFKIPGARLLSSSFNLQCALAILTEPNRAEGILGA